MAILLLLSTVSFTVEKHFCGDTLVDTAVFQKVKGCGMEMPTAVKKGCCKDEIEVVTGQDELNVNTYNALDFEQQLFLISYVFTFDSLFESLPKQIIPHKDYSPPNLIADIQVLDQVFII